MGNKEEVKLGKWKYPLIVIIQLALELTLTWIGIIIMIAAVVGLWKTKHVDKKTADKMALTVAATMLASIAIAAIFLVWMMFTYTPTVG